MFSLGSSGKLKRINYSQPQRDSRLIMPIERVDDWYAALKEFCRTAHDPSNLYQFKLKPGEMLGFNNIVKKIFEPHLPLHIIK